MSAVMDNSTSSDLDRLRLLVEDALRGPVDALITERGELQRFGEALRYPVGAGGKRLRPVLLLATLEALDGNLAGGAPPRCRSAISAGASSTPRSSTIAAGSTSLT